MRCRQALPGLVGENGIDPAELRKAGVTAGVVGLVFLLYGGLGSVAAASSSLHLIFGAPPTRGRSSRRSSGRWSC